MRKSSGYKPKPIVHPAMRMNLSKDAAINLKLMGYQALDSIAKGYGDYNMFDCLSMAINVTTVLAEKGYGDEYLDVCQKALDAVRRMGQRAVKLGKFGLDGDGYQEVKDCLDLHSQQIELCTRLTLSDAIFEVESRLKRQRRTA